MVLIVSQVFSQKIDWKPLASLPKKLTGEAVSLNNKIYFFAGENDSSVSLFVFDISLNNWQQLASLPKGIAFCALAEVGGKIYAIGGGLPVSNTTFEYNPATNTWITLAPMPSSRMHIACGVVNSKIYVIGGIISETTCVKDFHIYDPANNSWTIETPIPSFHNNPAIVAIDSLIYVIGGAITASYSSAILTKNVECYNTNTKKWTTKKELPVAILKPGAVVVNKKIIVMGGQISNSPYYSAGTYIYDPATNVWKTSTPLPKTNCFAGFSSKNNKIYVIGGFGISGNTYNVDSMKTYANVYEGTLSDTTTGIKYNNKVTGVSVYPNPTTGQFTLSFGTTPPKQANAEIYNAQGKLVLTKTIQEATNTVIDLTGYAKGMYMIKLVAGGLQFEDKILKKQ